MAERKKQKIAWKKNWEPRHVSMDECWQKLPPEIALYIIKLWENQRAHEMLSRMNRQDGGEPLLRGPESVRKAYGRDRIFQTSCGHIYAGWYKLVASGARRFKVYHLGSREKMTEHQEKKKKKENN